MFHSVLSLEQKNEFSTEAIVVSKTRRSRNVQMSLLLSTLKVLSKDPFLDPNVS